MSFYVGNAIFKFPFVTEVVDAANIATIHTIFNVFATVALFPFIKALEKLAYVLIPVSAYRTGLRSISGIHSDDCASVHLCLVY